MLTKIISHVCCYLYPAYASYKALSLPESSTEGNQQVEKWLMYWAVIGTWTAIEAVAGWAFVWIPFYTIGKTAVFLYLSLPQSDGSTYIYQRHLAPVFHEHEADIDAFLASLRSRLSAALASGLSWVWEKAKAQLNIVTPPESGSGLPQPPLVQPPTLQDPASGAVQQAYGLFSRYAGHYMPLAISALTAAAASATASRTATTSQPERNVVVPSSHIPAPSVSHPETLRSRTYQYASGPQNVQPGDIYPAAISSSRLSAPRSVSQPVRPVSSHHSSNESLNSAKTAQSGSSTGRWGEMSYEQIAREEALGAPPTPPKIRPELQENRRSSWFAWGEHAAPGSHDKTD